MHEALSTHPQISCVVSEIDPIALFEQGGDTFAWGNDTATNLRPAWGAVKVFEMMTGAPTDAAATHFGVKLAISKPRAAKSLKVLTEPEFSGVKIIRIVRRDSLAQVTSLVRARSRNVWSNPISQDRSAEASSKRPTKVAVSKGEFLRYFLSKAVIEKELDSITSSLNTLKLIYEDDIENDVNRALALSQEFLGIPKRSLELRQKKQGLPLGDTISNFDEISKFASHITELMQANDDLEQIKRRYSGLLWRQSIRQKSNNLMNRLRREIRPSSR